MQRRQTCHCLRVLGCLAPAVCLVSLCGGLEDNEKGWDGGPSPFCAWQPHGVPGPLSPSLHGPPSPTLPFLLHCTVFVPSACDYCYNTHWFMGSVGRVWFFFFFSQCCLALFSGTSLCDMSARLTFFQFVCAPSTLLCSSSFCMQPKTLKIFAWCSVLSRTPSCKTTLKSSTLPETFRPERYGWWVCAT